MPTKSDMKINVAHIVQYEYNPKAVYEHGGVSDGLPILITDKQIENGLSHKVITEYAYVWHDRDVYTKDEENPNRPWVVAGKRKPKHVHIVLWFKYQYPIKSIAKWFGVSPNQIDVPKYGRTHSVFIDQCIYITHESEKQQKLGKYRYPDSAVKSNFDFRMEIDASTTSTYGSAKFKRIKSQMENAVMRGEKSLRDVYREEPDIYRIDLKRLQMLRADYLTNRAPMPEFRMNFYVSGPGGAGKDVLCEALARSFFPDRDPEDFIFRAGAQGVKLDHYDGQEVVIWSDMRGFDLIKDLSGRGNVFNVFDTHPRRISQNVKYASVNLVNQINIVNSVQPYQEFMNSLANEYTDKTGTLHTAEDKVQAYRRFPIILPISMDDINSITMLINEGFFGGSFEKFVRMENVQTNISNLIQARKLRDDQRTIVEQHETKPILDAVNDIKNREESRDDPDLFSKLMSDKKDGSKTVISAVDAEGNSVDSELADDFKKSYDAKWELEDQYYMEEMGHAYEVYLHFYEELGKILYRMYLRGSGDKSLKDFKKILGNATMRSNYEAVKNVIDIYDVFLGCDACFDKKLLDYLRDLVDTCNMAYSEYEETIRNAVKHVSQSKQIVPEGPYDGSGYINFMKGIFEYAEKRNNV